MLRVTTGAFCKNLMQPAQQNALESVNESKLQRMDSLFKATRDIAKVMSDEAAEARRSDSKSFCELIVTIHDGCLHFIHLTAREFLMSAKPEAGSRWKDRFALGPGLHQEMSRCCISYLLLDDWIEIAPVATDHQALDQENRLPLLLSELEPSLLFDGWADLAIATIEVA
ncbi:hypothetical protein ARSEF4850_004682 [Beauveria asiatica]